jgi:hypothetical protein
MGSVMGILSEIFVGASVPVWLTCGKVNFFVPDFIHSMGRFRKESYIVVATKPSRRWYIFDCFEGDCSTLVFTPYNRKYCPRCGRQLELLFMGRC